MPRPQARFDRDRHGVVLPALLVALVLPAILWRAGLESSLWMDEVHSLQLSQLAPAQIVDLSARDAHPPGYFLALKGWLAAARRLGISPGTGWARGLGAVLWLGLVIAVWGLVRRSAGSIAAGLASWAVAGGAVAAALAVELRGYGAVFAAAVVAFLVMSRAETAGAAGDRRRAAAWWCCYALLAAAALWMHLLAAPLFLLLAGGWLVVWGHGPGTGRGTRLGLGAGAHLASLLLFLPWWVRVPRQLSALAGSGTEWMTPANAWELARVFAAWFPFGRVAPGSTWLALLGAATLLVPLAAAIGAGIRRRPWDRAAGGRSGGGLPVALGIAVAFVVLLWSLARWEVAPVFHGPRYPALAAGLWALGLAGLALAAAAPAGEGEATAPRRRWTAWLLLLPWLAAGVAGQLAALRQESRGGLRAARPAIEAALGSPDEPLYVSPSELAPFFRRSLAGLEVEPVEGVACGLGGRGRAVVLDVNRWPGIERVRDRLLARAVNRGLLAGAWSWQELPTPALGATLLRLTGAGPRAAELCRSALAPPRPWRRAPTARALPEDQLFAAGWSRLEIGDDLVPRRWGAAEEVSLRFDRPLAPGGHELHLVGHRTNRPSPVEAVCIVPPGGGPERCRPQRAGRFEIVVRFTLERRVGHPQALLRHPAWSPAAAGRSGDRRRLSVMLEAAWIEPAPGTAG